MSIQPVAIVRPEPSWVPVLANVIAPFLAAWFVMLLLPIAIPGFTPNYIRVLAGFLAVRFTLRTGDPRDLTYSRPSWEKAGK